MRLRGCIRSSAMSGTGGGGVDPVDPLWRLCCGYAPRNANMYTGSDSTRVLDVCIVYCMNSSHSVSIEIAALSIAFDSCHALECLTVGVQVSKCHAVRCVHRRRSDEFEINLVR